MSVWDPTDTTKRCPKCGRLLPIPEGWQMQVTDCLPCAVGELDVKDVPYLKILRLEGREQTE